MYVYITTLNGYRGSTYTYICTVSGYIGPLLELVLWCTRPLVAFQLHFEGWLIIHHFYLPPAKLFSLLRQMWSPRYLYEVTTSPPIWAISLMTPGLLCHRRQPEIYHEFPSWPHSSHESIDLLMLGWRRRYNRQRRPQPRRTMGWYPLSCCQIDPRLAGSQSRHPGPRDGWTCGSAAIQLAS